MTTKDELIFAVNGNIIVVKDPDPEVTVLHYLRYQLGLRGTKLGCGEGGCGACTVMLSKYDFESKRVKHFTVYACITSICKIHLMSVITIEGVGNVSKMHPIQKRIADYNGIQCGFCTPGIVMSMYTLMRNNPEPTEREIEDAFDGNLCRCTGYSSILSGCKTFACGAGDECCKVKKTGDLDKPKEDVVPPKIESTLDPTQEIIFPLQFMKKQEKSLTFCGKRLNWYIPSNLQELIELKKRFPKAKLLSGGTVVTLEGVSDYICVYQVPVLNEMAPKEGGLHVGAAVTITDLELQMKQLIKEKPKSQTQVLASIVEILPHMASSQVRNVGSVIGNLFVSGFAGDLQNILLAAHVQIKICSGSQERTEVMSQKFFGKDGGIKPGEVIVSFVFPWTKEGEIFKCYKQARRRTLDLAITNSAFFVSIKGTTIEDCRLVFGGLAPAPILASQTSKALKGLKWTEDIVNIGLDSLSQEFNALPDHPEGMHEYRETLASSFYLKFYLYVTQTLWDSLPPNKISGIGRVTLPLTKSTECYDKVPADMPKDDPVGRPVVIEAAYAQVTGTAKYVDDYPLLEKELYAAPVLSQKVHANILSVDAVEALAVEGVVAFISHVDIPEGGSNATGAGFQEEIFAKSEVHYYGQLIGLVLAEDRMLASRGAELVKVRYEELPVIVTIEDAIAAKSFHGYDRKVKRGDPDAEFSKCDKIVTRELRIGGQEHFYLETQSCIVAPTGEDGGIRVISSSQSLQYVNSFISRALGIMRNKIVSSVKRLGGAFGGKATRSCTLAAATAVAANKLGRPVRIMLERSDDMKYTGGRNPFLVKYKVGFQNDGSIKALSMELYSNAGYCIDFTAAVMDSALYKVDNAYYIPNFFVTTHICKTNLATNTAFRGFGGPQVVFAMETMFSDVALSLNRSISEIQKQHFYVKGQTTPYGMELDNCTIAACWDELLKVSNYTQKNSEKDEFNKNNLYKKRGIGMVPLKFPIGYDHNSGNQGGALIHILKDGSVMIYHGGIDSGQGINTKVLQICSRALGVPISKIYINETSTSTMANPSGTGYSVSTDIYGQATVNACNILNERLAPVKDANPSLTWEKMIKTAYQVPIDLTAKGFYRSDVKGMDWSGPDHIGKGVPVDYFTYGCACSLVEVDVLTGEFKVLETDIVMDVGRSINPLIDIGQIEGAFVQGMGLYTLEELLYLNESADAQQGTLSSTGPLLYKIPAFTDAPANLKVHLLHDSTNPKGLYGSKGIGEPALLLGSTVFFGIREAVLATTKDSKGNIENFVFNSPATAEKIRMNCKDSITERVTSKGKQPKKKIYVVA